MRSCVRVLRCDLDQLLAEASATSASQAGRRRWPGRRGAARRSGVLGRPVGLLSTTLDNLFYDFLPTNGLLFELLKVIPLDSMSS